MQGPLVDQLVEAGLVTEAQAQASDPGDPLVATIRVIQNLVDRGLDERTLAGFFVTKGFGPILQAAELARADHELVERLCPSDAHDLCAMPLRSTAAGAVVAMANPTDEHAVAKLSLALGDRILPTVAKLSDLLAAIDRAYPPDRPAMRSDPVASGATRPPTGVVSLVQEERDSEPPSAFASLASPVWDRAWSRSATEREVALPPSSHEIPLPTVSHAPSESESGPTPSPDSHRVRGSIDGLRDAATRDEAVRAACQACSAMSRGAAFLALRKGVFRGWDGAGEDVTSAGIRSLWVPASNPSILNDVMHSGKAFRGVYGETAADHLFRAAFGSHGREVAIIPVLIGRRLVGVLCANDPAVDTEDLERIADALGQTFERLIVSKKSET